ncbi:hypothetical protein K443DRAFT_682865 [Laccaria amethystina LaAM-08-1]|uniref:Lariat debranching enzyme C-terminal domain-containing protein n=1 Tax=Laccaria amethystina LaAM-08-1 TaxID=1095629 RepID=A0A0C9XD36_9AGAR|nr:hypothetical protein K443DRAFT_682865 [Laccaria amethystina LaAM-08-1]
MKIAIEGCCHGELDAIYSQLALLESQSRYKVDLLLICGDFEAFRNHKDLQVMESPEKYKVMKVFHQYYSGQKKAPVLTIVIGGNHEASNYFWELYHGGWLAPNIYFLGHAGCVQVNGIRIAGMSGIYKAGDYRLGYYERLPYDQRSMRSIYHTRQYNVNRLVHLTNPDIFLSHDWPQSIEHHGNLKTLLKLRPGFRASVNADTLGSPPLMMLLKRLKPKWWFAGHMHVRFEAEVKHARDAEGTQRGERGKQNQMAGVGKEKEIQDDKQTTKFLALDKCLPGRDFLEVIDFPTASSYPSPAQLTFDPEWLAITRAFHPFLSLEHAQVPFPREAEAERMVRDAREWVGRNVFQVPEGQDQPLPVSQPPRHAQGQGDGRTKQLPRTDGGARRRPQGEGEAKPPHDGTSHQSQSDGRPEPPLKCRPKLVEEIQRFVKTAAGVEETPEREWKAQPSTYTNPQTAAFCEMLDIENKINTSPVGRGAEDQSGLAVVDDRGAFPPFGGAAFPPLGVTSLLRGAGAGAGRGGRWTGGARGGGAAPVARETQHVPTVTEDAFPSLGSTTRARGRGRGRGRGSG